MTDGPAGRHTGFESVFLKLYAYSAHNSQCVCFCSLSTQNQIAPVILDLLTESYNANTELITSIHICSHMHKLDLSGQGLIAGDVLFVCGWLTKCARTYTSNYTCLNLHCMFVWVCTWKNAHDARVYFHKYVHVLTLYCMFSMHTHLSTECAVVHLSAFMSHSRRRCFISLPQLGQASQLGMQCGSFNLTNWNGGGFGLNLS